MMYLLAWMRSKKPGADVAVAAVVRDLQHVDEEVSVFVEQVRRRQRLLEMVTAPVAGEQQRLCSAAAIFGLDEELDAAQVGNALVRHRLQVGRANVGLLSGEPFEPLLLEVVDVGARGADDAHLEARDGDGVVVLLGHQLAAVEFLVRWDAQQASLARQAVPLIDRAQREAGQIETARLCRHVDIHQRAKARRDVVFMSDGFVKGVVPEL